jgi:hypothetical protein
VEKPDGLDEEPERGEDWEGSRAGQGEALGPDLGSGRRCRQPGMATRHGLPEVAGTQRRAGPRRGVRLENDQVACLDGQVCAAEVGEARDHPVVIPEALLRPESQAKQGNW